MRTALLALQHRDYRLLWLGHMLSTCGSQMRVVATTYQLYQLTHSPLSLGMLGASGLLPLLLLCLGAGLAADMVDRRRLMMAMQAGMITCSAALMTVTLNGTASAAWIYGLVALLSAFSTFDMPARQALIPSLVPREHLPNALSLNVLAWQMSAVVGPSLAGLIIANAGVAAVYFLDALSFFCVLMALLFMRYRAAPGPRATVSGLLEGLRFVFSRPLISTSMLLDFVAMFFGAANTMLPIFAAQILHVGVRKLGLLYAAPSAGAIVAGYLVAASANSMRRQGRTMLWAVACYGACTALFGWSRWYIATLVCLAGAGAADTVSAVIRSTLRQMLTPDELRGRMTAVNMLFFMGGPQLGEMEAGVAASLLGTGPSVVAGGLACVLAAALVALLVPQLRRYDC